MALFDSMLEGARNVLEVAVNCGVKRVMLTGSGAQYGALPSGMECFPDDTSLSCDSTSPGSAYGEAKRAQETLAALYARRHGIEVVFTRCFAFVGPGLPLDGHFAVGNFIRDALWHGRLALNSRGEALRSYLYAADLAVWLLGILAVGQSGQAYNVGSDEALSIAQLAIRVGGWLSPDKPVLIADAPASGPRSVYVPSITKARVLGLDVWTDLENAVKETAKWADTSGSGARNEMSGIEDK
ncbi:hypothetical protein AUC61_13380 [Pseudomonas sp. S25]|uniref:NAD-dependent epimerase/dehydratase domain-containing protein n=1 Tax=Pseudomonas maioricensis TaxID=1766623 RepID=A0ABS9ZLW7_9PSED|nr:hypothetical protein [Pseudomonas sp. S25]